MFPARGRRYRGRSPAVLAGGIPAVLRGVIASLTLFTVIPVPRGVALTMDRHTARHAVLSLPAVGALLGVLAMLPVLGVWRGAASGSPLLAASLCVVATAVLTRGLHMDGLADLADGLGSHRPSAEALEVMRRSDIGAFGVAALAFDIVVRVAALAAVFQAATIPIGLVAVVTASVTGRLAVVWAAGRGIPAACGGSFGALIAASVGRTAQLTTTVAAGGLVAVSGWWAGVTLSWAMWWLAAAAAGLGLAAVVCRHAVRRLGGMSGDVFGALVEVATTACLVVMAAGVTWAV